MSVTIKDIAKLANVSHTTVSRALNNSPLINEETKQRIRILADELHYTPNFNAKSLVLDRSYHLGLFFTTLSTGTSAGFLYEAVKGVNSIIKDQYHLIVKGIDDYKSFQSISRKSFDGMVVMSQSAEDQPFIDHVIAQGIPIVVLNRQVENGNVLNIVSDDGRGAFHLVEYMILQGHQDIAIIEGKEDFRSTQVRREGYLKALRTYGIPLIPEFTRSGRYDLESGFEAMKQLLKLPRQPTAVFCCNDDMALGAIKAISERGLRVPEDISLAGFDDNVFSAYITPSLTTVKRRIEQISREGASLLLDSIENKQPRQETIFVTTELVIRQSVCSRSPDSVNQ